MSTPFEVQDRIPVAILGATGCVGQKFIQLLENHPWFNIVAVCASERSIGKKYVNAVNWLLPTPIPSHIANMIVQPCVANLPCKLAFSGLDSSVAGEIEKEFAEAGYAVVSNTRNYRMHEDVPLVIGEVNSDHLVMVKKQAFKKGMIVTNPNCSVLGLVVALKPLLDLGLSDVQVVTMQAISGAGYPGVASLDIMDNVIPYINGEEEKIETEPLKILGILDKAHSVKKATIRISAQCNRVPVSDGHMQSVAVKFKNPVAREEIIKAWKNFKGEPQQLALPTAPLQPIHYFENQNYPQPKLHRNIDKGMGVSVGNLRNCSIMDFKFTLLAHNTVRGAAGAALMNGELLVSKGYI